jgi:hypothetical protein
MARCRMKSRKLLGRNWPKKTNLVVSIMNRTSRSDHQRNSGTISKTVSSLGAIPTAREIYASIFGDLPILKAPPNAGDFKLRVQTTPIQFAIEARSLKRALIGI